MSDLTYDEAPLLSVTDLTLSFGGVQALDGVSFDVLPGELFAVIGPNGAGKTSIFNCLNQVYRPQGGSILMGGREVIGKRPEQIAAMGIGRTFQNVALFADLDVVDNLLLGRHHLMRTGFAGAALRIPRARREERVHRAACDKILTLLDLARFRGVPVGLLPYGVQKRIELGRGLAMEPTLLLLDEPVAGMNLSETDEMAEVIGRIRSELETAIMLIEHDIYMVMNLADRVMCLDFGRVLAIGKPSEVQVDPAVVRAYLGPSVAVPSAVQTAGTSQ